MNFEIILNFAIFKIFPYVLFFYTIIWLLIFFRICFLYHKEESVYKKKKKGKDSFIKKPMLRSTKEIMNNQLEEKYKFELDKIKRQREFLRDIMPFIKIGK